MNDKKSITKQYPWIWLMLIPGQLVINRLLLYIAPMLDTAMKNPDTLGTPFPAITIMVFFMLIPTNIFVLIISIILTIVAYVKRKSDVDEKL